MSREPKSYQVMHLDLVRVAKDEVKEWTGLPQGIALIVLFCFIHRLTTGETVEQTFFKPKSPVDDYEI